MRKDFKYLSDDDVYVDTSCQSLRPDVVIAVMQEYYHKYNSCGERVKYRWGEIVDGKVDQTRGKVLDLLKLSSRKYFVSFTLNTTYGLNLILNQIKPGEYDAVITSEIEHNSVFLGSQVFAEKHGIARVVLSRHADGSIDMADIEQAVGEYKRPLFIFNSVSNIDGRRLGNLPEIVKYAHKVGGRIIVDAAQAMAHYYKDLRGVEADAICFSAHKMYSASLGAVVMKKDFLEELQISFLGGGMVDDVRADGYDMSYLSPNHIHTVFEPGVQAYAETMALNAAIDWLKRQDTSELSAKSQKLFDWLSARDGVVLINQKPSTVISFYVEKLDSHLLAKALSDQGIMARSGYFCCHYYLDHVKKYPALIRLSLGYHNTDEDIDKILKTLSKV
ncbi:MAG: aminotransferase class V-fold PLP-dependent enzyme [Candidatus Nomurabacteria bacterium]|nr:aminotransferase class V-fold PLP-dependent enzyme [Candidatus Nomurabacteria bacterium]